MSELGQRKHKAGGSAKSRWRSVSRAVLTSIKNSSATESGSLATSIASAFTGTMARFISELRGFEMLESVERLEIWLEDWEALDTAVHRFGLRNKCDFDPVNFAVTDGVSGQRLLTAQLRSEPGGFALLSRDANEAKELAFVGLPPQPASHSSHPNLGLIAHPSGVHLYKIAQRPTAAGEIGHSFLVQKTAGDDAGTTALRIEQRGSLSQWLGSCCGLAFDACVYDFYRGGPEAVAEMWPRWAATNTAKAGAYVLRFRPGCPASMRPLALAFALLQSLNKAFPELANILRTASMRHASAQGLYGSL